MKAKKLNTIISNFEDPEILSLQYNLEELIIEYAANEKEVYWIKFIAPVGFKCLEERDMMDYWSHKVLTDNWILEILEGGWLEMEKSRALISHQMFNLREFLIEGIDDCVSVLSTTEPIITPKEV